jgi:cell division control protein 11
MSFAGRRRGNKVKKGVQFTVMVVGALTLLSFSQTTWLDVFLSRFFSLKVPLGLDVRLLSIPFASLRFWPIKFPTIRTLHTSKKALELSRSMLVSFRASRSVGFPRLHIQITELEEDGVRIALTIVDTPGFGDNIDNEFAYVLSSSV